MRAAAHRFLSIGFQAALCLGGSIAAAGVFDDIGYTALLDSGATPPTGAAIRIDLVEASLTQLPMPPKYFPNPLDRELASTTLNDQSSIPGSTTSGHATDMARQFAGAVSSITPDVAIVDVYNASDWLANVLRVAQNVAPLRNTGVLANHSWVGSYSSLNLDISALERADWLVEEQDYIQVAGTDEGSDPILSHAMNVISVGYTGATSPLGTIDLDGVYVAGRGQPHLVAPRDNRSRATATVTSAVALLMDSAPGDTLPPEVVKALLMAGAARQTLNTGPQQLIDEGRGIDIADYGANPAGNGLDLVYGAGQLDIYASYRALMAGNQPSTEDGGAGIGSVGYHYDAGFGGAAGTNGLASYTFSTGPAAERLAATLVWNLDIEDSGGVFNPTRTLHPLDLALVDVSGGGALLVAASASAIDNTETIHIELQPLRDYELRVVRSDSGTFNWDYALAWNRVELQGDTMTVPALPAAWLVVAAAWLCCAARRLAVSARRRRA